MGCNRVTAFFIIAFLSVAATAHAQTVLMVSDRLCCTATGNCPGQGLGGQAVRLRCTYPTGATSIVGQSTTNSDGGFRIIVPRAQGLAIHNVLILPCVAFVRLPVDAALCPALSAINGLLQSVVIFSGVSASAVSGTPTRFYVLP